MQIVQGILHFYPTVKYCTKCDKHTTICMNSVLDSKGLIKHFQGPDCSKCRLCKEPLDNTNKAHFKTIDVDLDNLDDAEAIHEKLVSDYYPPMLQRIYECDYNIDLFRESY